ncbi:hypothetical protein PR202_gb18408 [Eleusine coracana subsp. coracana]|uniref:Uncharacterized protein n=1 Tax=Eleusine coracana subsp. coracana TaxID=191504 RepID=A0AAV5F667_ELECO|nr:hypothetical protein PR202_gb18408 [Eleusine coracana subsp. coracana]
MLITSALGRGFTAIHLPSLRTCSPATCWSMSRMVRALGSVCAGSPYVSSGAGALWVEVHRHVLLLLAQNLLHILLLQA